MTTPMPNDHVPSALNRFWLAATGTPVQIAVLIMSVWWISNGPVALAIGPSFAMNPVHACSVHVFGFIPVTVNGWHALFHLTTGLVGIACVRQRRAAVLFALGSGVLYIVAAGAGFSGGSTAFGIMAVDTFGNYVHLLEGAIMVLAGVIAHRLLTVVRTSAVGQNQ